MLGLYGFTYLHASALNLHPPLAKNAQVAWCFGGRFPEEVGAAGGGGLLGIGCLRLGSMAENTLIHWLRRCNLNKENDGGLWIR